MKVQLILVFVVSALRLASGYDIFEGFFKQSGPCFPVHDLPSDCNETLSRSFTPKSPLHGVNEPTTLVYLFTPNSKDKAESLHMCGGRLPSNSRYDPEADTEVIIHGFGDGVCRTGWMREMKEQLYQRQSNSSKHYNVILVDWTWGNTFDYYGAVMNSKVMGEQVGFVINNIINQAGVCGEFFHVIGQSLGAIASGFVGRSVPDLRRITALDPSYYDGSEPPNQRITYRDAQIVDVIHTNAYSCFAKGHGDKRLLGHADFYPNGGKFQASCYDFMFQALLKKDLFFALYGLMSRENCSHLQAIQYYKLSINPNGCEYVGIAAPSYKRFLRRTNYKGKGDRPWAVMGMDFEEYRMSDRRRKFYLKTRKVCPYYDNSYIIEETYPFNTSCTS